MKLIEQLRDYIKRKYPDATTKLTPPLHEDGVWWLDVRRSDMGLAIQWCQGSGFGITNVNRDSGYGEDPDELISTLEQAQSRVDQLLTTAERTAPPFAVLLARLRESRGLTQEELACRLGVRQATISGMEHRLDLQVSTLRRVIEALGGILEIFGNFPDARYRLDIVNGSASAADVTPAAAPMPKGAATEDAIFEIADRSPKVSYLTTSAVSPREEVVAAIVRLENDNAFNVLHDSGVFDRALEIASTIKASHEVIAMS